MNTFYRIFQVVFLYFVIDSVWGYQTIIKHQKQGESNIQSFTLNEGKQLSTPLEVKTNDSLIIELKQFNQPFEYVFAITKPKQPGQPKLRFPSTYDEKTSSIQFHLRTDLFLGPTGLYEVYLGFLHSKESPYQIKLGQLAWTLIQNEKFTSFGLQPTFEFTFPKEEHYTNPTLSWLFSIALVLPWFILLPGWIKLAAQMDLRFFGSTLLLMVFVIGFSYLGYLYWVHWNLLQTLPYLLGLFTLSVPVSRMALRRMHQWKRV